MNSGEFVQHTYYLALWINTISIFLYQNQGQPQAQVKRVLENGGLRPQFKQFQEG